MDNDTELDDGALPDEDTDPDSPRNDAASVDDVEGPPDDIPVAAERRGGF